LGTGRFSPGPAAGVWGLWDPRPAVNNFRFSSDTNGYFEIGNPTLAGEKRLVFSNTSRRIYLYSQTSGGEFGLWDLTTAPGNYRWKTDDNGTFVARGDIYSEKDLIKLGTAAQAGNKNVLLENTSRSVTFYLAGDGDVVGLYDFTGGYNRFTTNADGNMYVRADVVAFASDSRLKTNLRAVSDSPVADVCKLNGVRFDWNEHGPQPMRGTDVGLLAQDVQKVIPEAVAPAPFDNNYLTIRMNQQITALLVEAIKELNQRLKNLEG
jgi:hypothetical protein